MDVENDKAMYKLIQSSIGTKFVSRWSELMCSLALKAVRTVSFDVGGGKREVDIKRYARIEKIPGGEIENSEVIDGVMINKDITHPKMRRRIENPRIILLDCPLEYKKGESQTNIEVTQEDHWNRILQIEEEEVKRMCDAILAFKPDVVITEKGVSGKFAAWYGQVQMLTRRFPRSRSALPGQEQRHGYSPREKDGQQPNCPRHRRNDREPCGGSPGVGCWYQVRTV